MNNSVGEAVFTIKVDSASAKQSLNDWKSNVDSSMSSSAKSTETLSSSFESLAAAVGSLATAHLAFNGIANAIGSVTEAYNSYQASMNGIRAVAQATGNDVSASFEAIRGVTANGLITQEDAAAAMKNLQLYGYSIEEATQLINVMADAAVYNRQANYSVSEAVRVTTEGIRMENSVLSDASGITTNIAKMYENYAKELGTTTDKLTQAQKAQAVYNGVLQEGGTFAGNAEEYTNTLAGAQQQLSTAVTQVQQVLGSMFDSFAPIISGIADWVSQNQELVAGITTFVGILAGTAGLAAAIYVAISAITKITKAIATMGTIVKVATGGIAGLLAVVASIGAAFLVSNAVDNLTSSFEDTGSSADVAANKTAQLESQLGGLKKSADEAAEKLAELEAQLAKLDRNYNRSLKKIAVSHEENLAKLTEQIKEANVDYRRAIDERMAAFNVSLAKEERSHQEMVDELTTQLNFLQRYNNDYNKQKLAQVQFALAKEQALYEKQTAAEKAEIELQNAADKEKLDKKLTSLQKELDDEQAFMNKHRDTLNSVRDLILLDEIESLTEQYNEQKASYAKQIAEARKQGAAAADAYWDAYNEVQRSKLPGLMQFGIEAAKKIKNVMTYSVSEGNVSKVVDPATLQRIVNGGFASGGFTGRGNPDDVAGVVHKGEYVIPADQVNQNTGLPKAGGNTTVQNFTINLSGVLATSAQAKRELAAELQRALQQTNQARLA